MKLYVKNINTKTDYNIYITHNFCVNYFLGVFILAHVCNMITTAAMYIPRPLPLKFFQSSLYRVISIMKVVDSDLTAKLLLRGQRI